MKKMLVVCMSVFLLVCSACGISQADYDAAVSNAWQEGYDEGKDVGYDEGYSDGESSGYDSGFSSGASEGMAEGYDDGYDDGYADALGVQDPVYITFSGSKYHRSWCSYLSSSAILTSREEAIARGYTPCSRCNP